MQTMQQDTSLYHEDLTIRSSHGTEHSQSLAHKHMRNSRMMLCVCCASQVLFLPGNRLQFGMTRGADQHLREVNQGWMCSPCSEQRGRRQYEQHSSVWLWHT